MNTSDVYWYHVVYSNGNGAIGSVELGLIDDVFVPADIRDHIQKNQQLDYCCLVNWKKLQPHQISEETLNRFLEKTQ